MLKKITGSDIEGKGVVGLPDKPCLSRSEMQYKLEEIVRDVVIPVINENADETATVTDLNNLVIKGGSGDMYSRVYDTDGDGVVNSADDGIHMYTASVTDGILNLSGSGENGKFTAVSDIICEKVIVNGAEYRVRCGGGDEVSLYGGCVYLFFTDGATVNFSEGGRETAHKVVSSVTCPENPRENTIWADTDCEITQYCISSDKPEYAEGLLWIKTSNQGAAVNLLRRNAAIVKISGASVFSGGGEKGCSVSVYKDGVWNSTQIVIYDGVFADGYGIETAKSLNGTNKVTESDDGFTLYTKAYSGAVFSTFNAVINQVIDVGGYSSVEIDASSFASEGYKKMAVGLTQIKEGAEYKTYTPTYTEFAVYADKNTDGRISLDVSELTGEYWLMFSLGRYNGREASVKISGIRLIP